VSGSLSEKRFEILSREYEDEQDGLEKRIAELRVGLNHFSEDSEKARKFIEIVRKYTDFSELTAAMLNEFVEKILVHEAERINGQRTQKVEIYLNFTGKFEVPPQEETEPRSPEEDRKARWRAYYHGNRDKILAAKRIREERKEATKSEETCGKLKRSQTAEAQK
jgi:3-phenylpropionate/cinnamic acid dioxygenase small subunit